MIVTPDFSALLSVRLVAFFLQYTPYLQYLYSYFIRYFRHISTLSWMGHLLIFKTEAVFTDAKFVINNPEFQHRRPFYHDFVLIQRPYSQTQSSKSMIRNLVRRHFLRSFHSGRRPYSEWGIDHDQMFPTKQSRISWWRFSMFMNNLQQLEVLVIMAPPIINQ